MMGLTYTTSEIGTNLKEWVFKEFKIAREKPYDFLLIIYMKNAKGYGASISLRNMNILKKTTPARARRRDDGVSSVRTSTKTQQNPQLSMLAHDSQ